MSALSVLKVPGRVAFGGTDIGLVRDVMVIREGLQTPIEAEEYGGEPVDEVLARVVYRVGLALRGWDLVGVAAVYPNVSGGEVTWPGSGVKDAGWFRSQDAAALAFVPTDSNHPGFSFAQAIPRALEIQEVAYQSRTEHLLLVQFTAIRTVGGSVTWGI